MIRRGFTSRIGLFGSAVCLSLGFSACFTGIESTPRITDKELRKQNVTETPEQKISMSLTVTPLSKWAEGHPLLVTDSKLSMLLERERMVNEGDTIRLSGIESGRSITGDDIDILLFRSSDGTELRYRLDRKVGEVGAGFTIPFTVDLALVDSVESRLRGMKCYLMSPLRVDSLCHPTVNGRKYIPVTIVGVAPANDLYPVRIDMTDEYGTPISAVMTLGNDRKSTRNFDVIFSLSDPRLRHPKITDGIWNAIVDGKVVNGMTTEECLLSLGPPRDVRKGQNGSSYFEIWTYDNGSWLMFEDGLLSETRFDKR